MRKGLCLLLGGLMLGSLSLTAQNKLHVTESDTLCGEEAEVQIRRMWEEMQQSWYARIVEYQVHSQLCLPEVVRDSVSEDSLNVARLEALLNTTVFPMVYNEEIKRYINLYTKGLKSMPLILARAQRFFPFFEEVLDKYGVPLELKYLAVIESALRPEAVSRAGAVGLWQFIYGTGKLYGLEVTTFVDDRMDPAKATDAAARHLYDLSEMFDGNWPLALAAYNCGPGNVMKAIKRAGGAQDFWQIYNYLPRETRGYVPAFYGAMYAMKYHDLYGLEAAQTVVEAVDTVRVFRRLDFSKVSAVTGIPQEELKYYNPQYKRGIIPTTPTGASLTLPVKYILLFEESKDSIFRLQQKDELARISLPEQEGGSQSGPYYYKNRYHVVKSGESLTMISRKYGTSVSEILRLNHRKSTMIHPGERLIVGQTKVYTGKPAPAQPEKSGSATDTLNVPQSVRDSASVLPTDTVQIRL
ncbi:MAG: transglycosylase SLT domain-containing protein [Bacteroidales bacterium]|nr:transglycosylase SLT domain-containing protein [Bacteroidales bacterium]